MFRAIVRGRVLLLALSALPAAARLAAQTAKSDLPNAAINPLVDRSVDRSVSVGVDASLQHGGSQAVDRRPLSRVAVGSRAGARNTAMKSLMVSPEPQIVPMKVAPIIVFGPAPSYVATHVLAPTFPVLVPYPSTPTHAVRSTHSLGITLHSHFDSRQKLYGPKRLRGSSSNGSRVNR